MTSHISMGEAVSLLPRPTARGLVSRHAVWLTCLVAGLLWGGGTLAADFGSQALTNADIVSYTQSRVSSAQIIDKIHASQTDFDLSPEAVLSLKHNGVSDDVLAVMTVAASRTPAGRQSLPRLDTPGLSPLPDPFADMASPQSPGFLSPLPSPSPVPPSSTTMDGERFRNELATLAGGSTEAADAALAWMMANREHSLPLLRQAAASAGAEGQAAAILALGRVRDTASLDLLRRSLGSPGELVRRNAALALAELNDGQAISTAEAALRQPDINPLDGYIRLVGAARLVRASRELGAIIETNPNPANRAAAAWAIAEIGPPAAVVFPALERALRDDTDPHVRGEAARAIASLHDPRSASLLKAACRKDPAVRKVTLLAMADYPETVEFLVGVMKLGPDQIAADELDAARRSLQKLTGRDYELDGDRWSQWFANDSTAKTSMPPQPADPVVAAPDLSSLFGSLETGEARLAAQAAGPSPQVDVTAWGIAVDPMQIPMAPEVEAVSSRGAVEGLPAPGTGLGIGIGPGATSAAAGAPPLSPSDFPSVAADPAEAASPFRTWSSAASGTGGAEAPTAPALGRDEAFGAALAEGETRIWSGADMDGMFDSVPDEAEGMFPAFTAGSDAGMDAYGPAPIAGAAAPGLALPSAPIVSPLPASSAADPDPASSLRGIALPLPGMSGFAGGNEPAGTAMPPAAPPAEIPSPVATGYEDGPAGWDGDFGADFPASAGAPLSTVPLPADGAAEDGGFAPMESEFGGFTGILDGRDESGEEPTQLPGLGGEPSWAGSPVPEPGESLPGDENGTPEAFGQAGGLMPAPPETASPAQAASLPSLPADLLSGMRGDGADDPPEAVDPALPLGADETLVYDPVHPADGELSGLLLPGFPSEGHGEPEPGDYTTLLFPDDGFGLGEPYFEQVDRLSGQEEGPGEEGTGSLGGLSLPLPTESAPVAAPADGPSVSGGLRPPAPMPTPSPESAGAVPPVPPEGLTPGTVPPAPLSSGNLVFVEPEPGQIVIGDDLFEGGMPVGGSEGETPYAAFEDEDASASSAGFVESFADDPEPGSGMPEGLPMPMSPAEEAEEDMPESLPAVPAAAPEPREALTRPPGEAAISARVLEVEDLGILGENGDMLPEDEPVQDTAGDDWQAGSATEEEDGGLVSEVWEVEDGESGSGAPAGIIPEGIPVLSEDEIYTDPGPDGEVRRPASSSPAPGREETSPRRKRNPPRHRR